MEKKLLAKDLNAILSYGVECRVFNGEKYEQRYGKKAFDIELTPEWYLTILSDSGYEGVKPYLRPMSSMTEREQRQFDSFCVIDEEAWKGNGIIGFKNQARIMAEAIDWLNAHHFDYRGLIEKGLALEAPEGMYK